MNLPKLLVLLFMILATCNNKQLDHDQVLVKQVAEKYISALIKNNKTVGNKIIIDVDGDYWSSQLDYTHLSMIKNFGAKKESDIVDFFKVFNTEGLYDLNKNRKFENWSKIFPNLEFNKNKEADIIISLPILSKDRNYAIFYIGTKFSGEFRVYKRVAGEWKDFASGLAWIS